MTDDIPPTDPPSYPKSGTYADLLFWHLEIWGTGNGGTMIVEGERWNPKDFLFKIFGDSGGSDNSRAKLENWLGKAGPPRRPDDKNVENALFGDPPTFQRWRIDLRGAHARSRGKHKDGRYKNQRTIAFNAENLGDISLAATAIVSEVVPALKQQSELAKETRNQIDRIEDLIRNAAFMAKVADIGLTTDQVRNLLRQFGMAHAPIDQAERLLLNSAEELQKVREQLSRLSNHDPVVKQLRDQALEAIDCADLDEAKSLILRAVERDVQSIDELKDALQSRRLSAANSLGQAGRIASAQASFNDAADLFARAARISEPADVHVSWWHWIDAASAHAFRASIIPGEQDARAAIEIIERHNLPLAERLGDPILLQRAQYELADDLRVLAERVPAKEGIPLLRRALTVAHNAFDQISPRSSASVRSSSMARIGFIQLALAHAVLGDERSELLRGAVSSYRKMTNILNSEESNMNLEYQGDLARSLIALSAIIQDSEAIDIIEEAVFISQNVASKLSDTSSTSLFYAKINLSGALVKAAEISGANRANHLLYSALEEIESAVDMVDEHEWPMMWSFALSEKASVLRSISQYISKDDAIKAINSSIISYKSVMSVYSIENTPHEWIRVCNNLAGSYYTMSKICDENAVEELHNAEHILREVVNCSSSIDGYAGNIIALNHLGIVLKELALKDDPSKATDYLTEAIDCHVRALNFRSSENEPKEWSEISANLAFSEVYLAILNEDDQLKFNASRRFLNVIELCRTKGYAYIAEECERMLDNMKDKNIL